MPLDLFTIALLTALKFFTAFIGVLVGSGGLILIPSMIAFGIPATEAVANARISNIGQWTAGLFNFNQAGHINRRLAVSITAVALVSSSLAALFVLTVNELLLTKFIGVTILVLLAITMLSQQRGIADRWPRGKGAQAVGYLMVFAAMFVSTVTGGGGILLTNTLIFFFGQTFLSSAGTRSLMTLASVLLASFIFVLAGLIIWELAVPLVVSGTAGGWVGSKYAIKKGNQWYKRVFVIAAAALGIWMVIGG